jgi:hypothetical protein
MNNLLDKIKSAFAAVKEAEAAVNEAAKAERAEVVSRSKALGKLLLEAKERHPKLADFKTFLKEVNGLGLSRAYDCMRVAGGRTTVEKLRAQATNRKRKSRANKKSEPAAIPAPDSVTDPHVTESPAPKKDYSSTEALAEFTVACRHLLPKITDEADRQKARQLVVELTTNKMSEAA